ncbi:hypothetical protein C8Q76DRAFT_632996 [Earliella scabrosa]|nr:hypothetical protein C8Q76DRAFT_632996 [Earliella scabrosa]
MPRVRLPRPNEPYLYHVLSVLKIDCPDLFRQELRVSPWTFDRLLAAIINDPVFANNSQNSQFSVQTQLTITLYRFGHYGNAAGVQKVANWAGDKDLAVLPVGDQAIRVSRNDAPGPADSVRHAVPPVDEAPLVATCLITSPSQYEWASSLLMVDGTLIPLYVRPHWYGKSYFDRKNDYSLNVQVRVLVVSDPIVILILAHADHLAS